MKTWIVVAHRAGARLVEAGDDDALRVFEAIDYPDGRAKEPEDGEPRESQREHAVVVFAGQLADKLQKGRIAHRYQELVIIAAPRFLGALRRALDASTAALVRGTLDKDFGGLSDHELIRRLEAL